VRRAKDDGKFKGPVVGPIGHYIKITAGKEKFSAIAELALARGTLDRFIVTNNDDRRVLQQIRQQVGCKADCGIFQTGNRPRFSVPAPPSPGVETVATVLTVENDLVFNCLVDNARIDQIALCDDIDSSERLLLYRNEKGQDALKGNIKDVYCLPDGDHWTVKGGSKALFTNEKQMRKTIGVDATAAIRQARAEETQLRSELQQYRSEEAKLEHEHSKHQIDWNQAKNALQKNQEMIKSLAENVDDLRAEIETSANVVVDTAEYENDVEQCEQELEALAQEEDRINRETSELQPEIEVTKGRINECAARNDRVLADMQEADQSLTQFLESKTQQEDLLDKKRQKLEKYHAAIDKIREKVNICDAKKNEALRRARQMWFRFQIFDKTSKDAKDEELVISQEEVHVEPTEEELEAIEPIQVERDMNYYEAKMNKCKEKIEHEKQRRQIAKDDPTVAYEKYVRALSDLMNQKEHVQESEVKIADLRSDLNKRVKRWKAMQRHLEDYTAIKFNELLSLNQFSGNVEFDHEAETLDLLVSRGESKGSRNKDVKSLR